MSFATRVKNARKQARLTQKELADRVGVSQTAMHKLEVGGSLTSRKTVAIALTCGVDPIWLETGRGEMALPGYSPETGDGEKPVDRITESSIAVPCPVPKPIYNLLQHNRSSSIVRTKKKPSIINILGTNCV